MRRNRHNSGLSELVPIFLQSPFPRGFLGTALLALSNGVLATASMMQVARLAPEGLREEVKAAGGSEEVVWEE